MLNLPPPVGQIGTTAINADSAAFSGWATGCSIKRGYKNVANPILGYATVGDSTMALGMAGSNGVVSLGDGGVAIVTFANPIKNILGNDFAVFENGFSDTFLELAFVEVSSDGIQFFRFQATSNIPITKQLGNDAVIDATQINNLAGKYRALYGTPFDLQELAGKSGLDVNNITHVKIVDVVGSIQNIYATYDKNNNKINDPWPTDFASSGFDLDAVGIINQATATTINDCNASVIKLSVFPNPVQDKAIIQYYLDKNSDVDITIISIAGEIVYTDQKSNQSQGLQTIPLINFNLNNGIYFLKVENTTAIAVQKIIISK